MEKPDPCVAQGSEEEEDTLSLSDLSMYDDQNVEFEPHVEEPSLSDDVEQDFEFSSEMMITSTDSLNHVVFCGKILYVSPKNIQIFESKGMHSGMRIERKVSIMASKRKSRWYLLMFGFGSSKFPKEMQIKDLKRRKTSTLSKCKSYTNCDGYVARRGMGKSQGLIRFLQCGGGINDSNSEIGDSPSKNLCQKV